MSVGVSSGGSSAAHTAILILPARDAVRHPLPAVLWVDGKLDCLPYQCALRGVQDSEGEGESGLQEPCHSGIDHYQLLCKISKYD